MKPIIAIVAAILGITVVITRSAEPARSAKLHHAPGIDEADLEVGPMVAAPSIAELGVQTATSSTAAGVSEKVNSEPSADDEEFEKETLLRDNLALLQAELSLTRDQKASVERSLQARDVQVAVCHAEIRASRVLWIWDHDRRAREIMAACQARISACLSPGQRQRYFDLLESGKLSEGVAFEITPDITVVR